MSYSIAIYSDEQKNFPIPKVGDIFIVEEIGEAVDLHYGKCTIVKLRPGKENNRMSNNTSIGGGIGFVGLLTIVFIVLKLTKVIDWSWWWVLSPIWIMVLFTLLVILVMYLIYEWLDYRKKKKLGRR